MKRFLSLLVALIILVPAGVNAAPTKTVQGVKVTPHFDLRVRQEFLENVFYWAPPEDRQWLRIRTRAGFRVQKSHHTFTFQLGNEHRRLQKPEPAEFDWDELFIDQAFYDYKPTDDFRLTLGRQNIIWDDGFLVLEGHPLDGSRSIYQDGLRFRTRRLDFFGVVNSREDPYVLAGDLDRHLSDYDERGMGLRVAFGRHSLAAIWKREEDPDHLVPTSDIYTFGGRLGFDLPRDFAGFFEGALQQQESVYDPTGGTTAGKAYALQFGAKGALNCKSNLEAGGFLYSGRNNDTLPFRTPWGRYPKWSELYIYTLLHEGGDGRVHVAAWENIAGLRAKLSGPIRHNIEGRVELMPLWAPEPDWQARGLLWKAGLEFQLPENIKGHLIYEGLRYGDFHDIPEGAGQTAHFIRWQLTYTY